jgi:hypothetical protein
MSGTSFEYAVRHRVWLSKRHRPLGNARERADGHPFPRSDLQACGPAARRVTRDNGFIIAAAAYGQSKFANRVGMWDLRDAP